MSGSIDLATIRQLLQALHPLVAPAAQPASLSMGAAVRQNLEPNSEEANEILNSTWHQQLASQRPWTPGADPKMAIGTEPRGSVWFENGEDGYVPQYTPPSPNSPPATNDTLEIHGGKHSGLGQAMMYPRDPQNISATLPSHEDIAGLLQALHAISPDHTWQAIARLLGQAPKATPVKTEGA